MSIGPVHKALADAVDAGLVVDNVASRAKAPRPWRIRSPRVFTWLPSELAGFLRSVESDRLAAVWRLACMTGMRRGELLGLRWEDVDLERRRLSVWRSFVEVNYRVVESTPKGSAARTIDLDRRTINALADHRLRQQEEALEWGGAYEYSDLVVAWQNGSPIHPQAFSSMFRTRVREAGLRRIRLHDLRHTHATLALQAGVPVTVVSERLGHHSPGFTLRQYAHALPGIQARAAAVVAEMIQDHEADAVEAHAARESQQRSYKRRTIDRGSEYHRLIPLFVSCVDMASSRRIMGVSAANTDGRLAGSRSTLTYDPEMWGKR